MTKLNVVDVKADTGAVIEPPPCRFSAMAGPFPSAVVKFSPTTLICVPTGADVGLKLVIFGLPNDGTMTVESLALALAEPPPVTVTAFTWGEVAFGATFTVTTTGG